MPKVVVVLGRGADAPTSQPMERDSKQLKKYLKQLREEGVRFKLKRYRVPRGAPKRNGCTARSLAPAGRR
jgi:hypothetical protein